LQGATLQSAGFTEGFRKMNFFAQFNADEFLFPFAHATKFSPAIHRAEIVNNL
jgi:hypothetical protein